MKKQPFLTGWTCNGAPVTLPHDAMLSTERRADAPSGSAGAFFAGGKYRYEKTFTRPAEEHAILEFEGVYRNAKVFVNGEEAGGAAYGYLPFFVTLDGRLKDGENTVVVECDNLEQPDSRWYSGAGIYRPVWLHTGNGSVIEPETVRVRTVSTDPAVIEVRTEKDARVRVLDGAAVLAEAEGTQISLKIPGAELWCENNPKLYTLRVSTETDTADISFGIRKITWSNRGLFVNGIETKLRGGCLHHDNGILGAATYDESEQRRVRILKEAGFNAIRSSHNPASRALIEACDRLGVYLMDEAWDMWFQHKTQYDYASQWREHYRDDLKAIVRRDYNHPSVLMYSIGNEVSEPAKEEGVEKAKEMAELLRQLDPDRPVTGGFNLFIISSAKKGKGIYNEDGSGRDDSDDKKMTGMNSTLFNLITSIVGSGMNMAANSKAVDLVTTPVLDAVDIAGYNYASGRYEKEGKAHPDRIVVGSETFPQDLAKNWAKVEKLPYLIGDFMWTAIDYLGEAGIGAWAYTPDGKGFNKPYPWLLGDTGAFDILGDPNGEALWASAVWKKADGPCIAVQPINHAAKPSKGVWRGTNAVPSWSWNGCEGKRAVVEVYTEADRVELYLNGTPCGKAKAKESRAVFKIPYQPGKLEAVVFDEAGREMGRTALLSAKDAKIRVAPEKTAAKPGEVVYVPVTVADENGTVEANADRQIRFSVENGELLGFGSANPRTEERFLDGSYTTYYGRALAAVRLGRSGKTTVTAADGTDSVSAEIGITEEGK